VHVIDVTLSYVASARPSKSPDPNAVASPERIARTRTRVSGVSQSQRRFYDLKNMNEKSQIKKREIHVTLNFRRSIFLSTASSRSGSPSSRLSYATYNREGESLISRPRRLSGHAVGSTSNSREPSPQRFGMDRSFASKLRYDYLYINKIMFKSYYIYIL